MTAKYPGTCDECGGPIEPGEKIKWSKTWVQHAGECFDAEAASEAAYFDQIERTPEIRGFCDDSPESHGAGGGDPDPGYL